MRVALFLFIALCFGFCVFVFTGNYMDRRRVASLICAFHACGWTLFVARELRWLPRIAAEVWLAAASSIGILSVVVLLHSELQRPEPFGWVRWWKGWRRKRRAIQGKVSRG